MTGRLIRLSDYRNDKVLLCFFRYAGCPWCNLAVHRLALEMPHFEKLGLKVIAFLQSDADHIQRYIYDRHIPPPPFPIIPDPKRRIYSRYGVGTSLAAGIRSVPKLPDWLRATIDKSFRHGVVDGNLGLVPAQFLIGPDLKVYKAHYGRDYFDDISMVELLEFAQFGPVDGDMYTG
jgi:peroxiredoxin